MSRSILICLFLLSSFLRAAEFYSPSGKTVLKFSLYYGSIQYSVSHNNKVIISKGELGLSFKSFELNQFKSFSFKEKVVAETWNPVWGQQNKIENNYREIRVKFKSTSGNKLIVCFRLYDDGFAFQYQVPKQKKAKNLELIKELSAFDLKEVEKCWWSWADYNTLEKNYYSTSLDSVEHVACPFTLKRKDGLFISIHEAKLDDYSMMSLRKTATNRFEVNLAPWNDGVLVKSHKSLESPWRAFMFAESSGSLLTNNLITNLNDPCVLKDVSWIQPMTYCGIWWEMHLGISTWMAGERHGSHTENAKRYIDFAAKYGINGVLLEGWNTGWEYWGKKRAFDFTTPYPDLNLKEVVDYARSKGIEIIGHHETGGDTKTYEDNVEEAFSFYHDMGIRVVKTGYAGPVIPEGENHHGQCMVRHYNKIMKLAARYHIMLDVHEPIVLSGLSRTYPNLMTAEGVRGMEWNAWSEGNSPTHTCTLPFTRGIAGPIDYTPGIVDIDLSTHTDERQKWNSLHTGNTSVHSTLANQLALTIVLYSPLQMFADLPENYESVPGMELLRDLPASWDESRVLGSSIGEYIYVARRSGSTWYVAGITNEQNRLFEFNADFLDEGGSYEGSYIFDAHDAHFEKNPEAHDYNSVNLKTGEHFYIELAPGGGFILKLEKVN